MTAPFTPGAYLKRRREAAGLSFADVAARMRTEPQEAEHLRIERLKLIETDAAPMTLTTIVGLRLIYRFNIHVLSLLEAIAQDAPATPPNLCRICACSNHDPCVYPDGGYCWWRAEAEDLCSSCAELSTVRAA